MADQVEPPPLFENVDFERAEKEDDDLFVSAIQDTAPQFEEISQELTNGDSCLAKPKINDTKGEMETIPINNDPSLPTSMEQVEAERRDEFLDISITEPQKVGDGMGAYMAYRVTTKTNMPIFKKREFYVIRRFSDFLGLHDKLTEKYLKVGRIIPPAPEKSVLGMTKIKMSSQSEGGNTSNGNDFVERRRASLERYLKRTAQHPVLILDPDFREFLESDIELPKATSTSALSSAGVMRLFNKVGETVNKITYKMDETDPWFEEKLAHVEGLEAQLRKLHTSVEAMVAYRKELANLTNGVSRSAALLSACEDHNSLSRALSHLADTEEKVEALHLEQANTDFFILCELLKDYLGLLGAVRDAFHERTKLFQHWQHSQQMLAKKREAKAKLELTSRTDKLDQANTEVIEWESKVERGQENFDKISQMIKKEMDRFEKCRIHDFKIMFIKYLENHLEHQGQFVWFHTFLNMDTASTSTSLVGASPPKKRKLLNFGALSLSEKQSIINIYKQMLNDESTMKMTSIVSKIVTALGIANSTVYRTIKEYRTGNITSPKKLGGRPSIVRRLNEGTKHSVRQIIHGFFYENEMPTLDKILQKINSPDLPKMCRSSLHKFMKEINFNM